MVLQAEQTAWLASAAGGEVEPTATDHLKYEWDIEPSSTLKAVFTGDTSVDAGFVAAATADAESSSSDAVVIESGDAATFGVVLEESPFYSEAGGQVGEAARVRGRVCRHRLCLERGVQGARVVSGGAAGGVRTHAHRRQDLERPAGFR